MKKVSLVLAVGVFALAGCARHYAVSMNNGVKVYTKSKPKLEHGYYVFKDGSGKKVAVAAGDVLQIQPASMEGKSGGNFLPSNH